MQTAYGTRHLFPLLRWICSLTCSAFSAAGTGKAQAHAAAQGGQAAVRHHDELMAKAREKLGVDLSEYKMLGIGARTPPQYVYSSVLNCAICSWH